MALPRDGLLQAWIKSYKENGYTVVERNRGRYAKEENKDSSRIRRRTQALKGRELEAYRRERIHKKIESLSHKKEKSQKKKSQ